MSVDVDVLVVGAGITGIYQLYTTREAGFSVRLLEAGDGVGGTWFWNRYPDARFDSESYTYGYFFSQELFDEWEWSEHFAAQPEIERYLNHVVDRFDLRQHMRFGARVESSVYDEGARTWTVTTNDGSTHRARFLVAATGVLSIPYYPDVPGREAFAGEQYHTARWPQTPVDVRGKRVAVIGTGSSGVQIVPAIAPEVAELVVYQRGANWCTPLNNSPITPDEQARLRAEFDRIRKVCNTSYSGFLHEPNDRLWADDTPEQHQAFYEQMWNSPGFSTLISHYRDVMTDRTANRDWCEFLSGKIRSIVADPATADKLIPNDHWFGQKRPPFVNGYYEAFNRPNVSLVDLKATPMTRVTETGIETSDGLREFDLIVWATGFDFGTGALNRMGIRGRDGRALEHDWVDGPHTYLGVCCVGYPNLFFPAGPHAAMGNNPRYASDQVDFVTDLLVWARDHGHTEVEIGAAAEAEWTDMVDTNAAFGFSRASYFFGSNVPGKPVKYLLNPLGRPKLFEEIGKVVDSGYAAFEVR